MLKQKIDKLETWSEVCLFIGYPREMKGGFLYSSQNKKIIVNTKDIFLEENCMKNYKPKNEITLEETLW